MKLQPLLRSVCLINMRVRSYVISRILLIAGAIFVQCTAHDEPILVADVRWCDLAPDPGLCNAYIERYYYDQAERRCKVFVWGGCQGVVPFETLEQCRACE